MTIHCIYLTKMCSIPYDGKTTVWYIDIVSSFQLHYLGLILDIKI